MVTAFGGAGVAGTSGRFGVAVKAAIVRDGRLLVLYKAQEEARCDPEPNRRVDLPGGRMRFGESPVAALRREVAEETGLVIEVGAPLQTWHYVKEQFQLIGINYLCTYQAGEVVLSDEHERFAWLTEREMSARHPAEQREFAAAYRYAAE